MMTVTKNKEIVLALESWRNADAKIWLFHVTHKRMAIRLAIRGFPTALYIIGNDCDKISGPFSWKNAYIKYNRDDENGIECETCRIYDDAVGFSLICSSVILIPVPTKHLAQSFDDFFDKKE